MHVLSWNCKQKFGTYILKSFSYSHIRKRAMKRLVAQLQESKRDDYDPDERGEVTAVGEHHGGSFRTYFAHKVTKLREQHQPNLSGDKSTQIFKGCIMYVNGLTELPIEELRRLISLHGGEHIMYRAVKITHYVCNHFTDAQLKLEHAKVKLNAKNKVHNVTVAWVLESIQQMRRLNENLYIPKGLKDHGSVLTKSFLATSSSGTSSSNTFSKTDDSNVSRDDINSNNSSSSNSSSSRNSGGTGQPKTATEGRPPQSHHNISLTYSQESFLDSIPPELREEALLQLEQQSRNVVGTGKESRETVSDQKQVIDLFTPPAENDTPEQNNQVVIEDPSVVHRRSSLSSMVECIHYNAEGELCPSKAVMYRMKEYIHTLVDTASLDTTETERNNTLLMLVHLLTDYIAYLQSQHQYDLVKFLLAELKRKCRAADSLRYRDHFIESAACSDLSKRRRVETHEIWGDFYNAVAAKCCRYVEKSAL